VTKERNLADGFRNVKHFENMFMLPRIVVDTARDLLTAFNNKQEKKVHGVRSEAFALAVVYLASNMQSVGKTIKEMSATAQVDEREIRAFIKRVQKSVPEALANKTTAEDFIRIIVSDIEGPMLLERFACEILPRALNHVCNVACIGKCVEGKRTSTLAAGVVLTAAKHATIPVKSDDVSASMQIGKATAVSMMKCIEGHWSGMFADRSSDAVLMEMRQTEVGVQAALAPTLAQDKAPIIRI
jgi:transcription initiation factor TFIIIB Brf1 subunit/transcription initiation factor TFIIB